MNRFGIRYVTPTISDDLITSCIVCKKNNVKVLLNPSGHFILPFSIKIMVREEKVTFKK